MTSLTWHERAFAELSVLELYEIVMLREQVFVVEQRCVYLDADGHDPGCRHVFATDRLGAIVAYARLVPAGVTFGDACSIGRVIVAPAARGGQLGRALMQRAIAACGPVRIALAAQAHLEPFYASLGFARTGEPYDEDGIPHVDMLRTP